LTAWRRTSRTCATEPEVPQWTNAQDMIYLGGVILIGVSAGAMCWFRTFLWRDTAGALSVANGLGMIAGSMTPHALIERERTARMETLVSTGDLAGGFPLENDAALVFRNGATAETFTRNGQMQDADSLLVQLTAGRHGRPLSAPAPDTARHRFQTRGELVHAKAERQAKRGGQGCEPVVWIQAVPA